MPKKCLTRAAGAKSVPEVGSRRGSRHRDSSSSLSTRSSAATIKQFKKEQLIQKKAQEASRQVGNSTSAVPKHLVSHMLPYFYPDDYEYDPSDDDDEGDGGSGVEVRRQLVSHVTPCCYPISGTADDVDAASPTSAVVPRHLESHVTRYCCPVADTFDDDDDDDDDDDNDEDVLSPRSDAVRPRIESRVVSYCQPVDDDSAVVDVDERPKLHRPKRTNYVPRHLQSHLFGSSDDDSGGQTQGRTGLNCQMTRDHRNSRDSLFPDVDSKPPRRVGGRRPLASNLFEESKPKSRPMSITIVKREPEDTKENIFGSQSSPVPLRCRTRYRENDTKKVIFGGDEKDDESPPPTPCSRHFEDTTEKLFGETYGIKEAEEEYARRRCPLSEDTHMTLFGPAPAPPSQPPQRPKSARSFAATHENLFGQQAPSHCGGRRVLLRRENTFNNLFGETQARRVAAPGIDERYTRKNPKILQDSLTQVLSMDDPRHGPAPPGRRIRKPVDPMESFRRQPETLLSPITHEQLSLINSLRASGPGDAHSTPAITSCRRRNLSTWDTVNTITGEALPYSVSEHTLQVRNAWVEGKIQDSVAPLPPPPETADHIVHA